jgi:hypothetical protein
MAMSIAIGPHRRVWPIIVRVVAVVPVVMWRVKNDIDLSLNTKLSRFCRSRVANEASSGYNQ